MKTFQMLLFRRVLLSDYPEKNGIIFLKISMFDSRFNKIK